jgi:2-phospho-L-lactate guanylyltransferase
MQVLAVVPVQRLEQAKSRLAPALEPAARQALVRELAERTIRVLRSVPAVAVIGLLTPDPSLASLASRWGVRTLRDAAHGLNDAVRLAQAEACRLHLPALLIVLGDLPLLDPHAIRHALTLLESPGVVLAPDRHGTGTNLLALAPPDVIAPAFGPFSRWRHRRAAAGARCMIRELWSRALVLDLDTPEDLALVHRVREGER